jgi:tyrosyl-tRNA synthetase
MTFLGEKPNIGIIMGILPGTDGVVKMSKSLGNHIPLNSSPEDMYGKVMSIPDTSMAQYAKLVTRWGPSEVTEFEDAIKTDRVHPRDLKMKLAREITATYYNEKDADLAQLAFIELFQQKNIPSDMPEYSLRLGQSLVEVMVSAGLVSSKSDGKRLVEQKGVRLDGETLTEFDSPFPHPGVLQVGKRKFVRVK